MKVLVLATGIAAALVAGGAQAATYVVQAKALAFDQALAQKMEANGGQVLRSLEPTNTNGNNVNLDAETIIATETGLRYQLALNALDGKYNVLRASLRTQ